MKIRILGILFAICGWAGCGVTPLSEYPIEVACNVHCEYLDEAIDFWNHALAEQIFIRNDAPQSIIQIIGAANHTLPSTARATLFSNSCLIEVREDLIYTDDRGFIHSTFFGPHIYRHELGHCILGYGHSDDPQSVMHETGFGTKLDNYIAEKF